MPKHLFAASFIFRIASNTHTNKKQPLGYALTLDLY